MNQSEDIGMFLVGILPFLLALLVGSIFLLAFILSEKKLKIEKDLNLIFSERCTSYLDGMKHIITKVRFYNEFMVISSWKKAVLEYGEILEVTQGRVLLSKSIEIRHNKRNLPTISILFNDLNKPLVFLQSKISKDV